MTDDTLRTVRRRLDHVVSTIETVHGHLDADADGRALTRALGTLEQVEADLDDLDELVDLDDLDNPATTRPPRDRWPVVEALRRPAARLQS